MALAPLFGPPLESTFDEQKTEGRKNVYICRFFFNLLKVNICVLKHILNVSSDLQ